MTAMHDAIGDDRRGQRLTPRRANTFRRADHGRPKRVDPNMGSSLLPAIFHFLAWLTLALSLCGTAARASDLVVERAWLEDKTGRLSWDDIRQMPMTPLGGVLSIGFGAAPAWIRLRIDPSTVNAAEVDRLYLRIRPMYLNDIDLFDPLQVPPRRGPIGDRYPVSSQAIPAATFVFELPVGDGPRDIWLRVRSTSQRLVYAEVLTPHDLRLSEALITQMGALYLGCIAMFFLWGFTHTLIRPEPMMLSFVIYQGSWFILGSIFLGYLYLYFSEDWPAGLLDTLTNIVIMIASASFLSYSSVLLNELRATRWTRHMITFVLAVYSMLLVGVLSGHERNALTVNMALILMLPLIQAALAMTSRPSQSSQTYTAPFPKESLSRPFVQFYLCMTSIFALATALPGLGLLQGAVPSLYIVFFYSLSVGVLMIVMLQYRAWQMVRQQSRWRAIVDEAKARAIQEQANREDRERLLAMLGHELKTPLGTMRMLIADKQVPGELARRIDNAAVEMAHVVDLALRSGQVEAGRIALRMQDVSLLPVIEAVAREVPGGDRVLLEAPAGQDAVVRTDPHVLEVVVRNLLDNALKYGPPDAAVRASLGPVDASGGWTLSVANPVGRAGLPDPGLVFKKYYRSPKASYRGGSGLGLYLAHGLVGLLGGELRYEPHEGEVRFTLVMRRPRDAEPTP